MKRNYIQPATQVATMKALSLLMASGDPFGINTNTGASYNPGGANAGTGV